MKPIARLFAIATVVVLLQAVTPSWGEPPDPKDSDAPQRIAGNTACGALALNIDTDAGFPTAIDHAPGSNNIGNCRPAVGSGALLLKRRDNVFPGRPDELWLLERRIMDAEPKMMTEDDLRLARIIPGLMQTREHLKAILERLKIDGR